MNPDQPIAPAPGNSYDFIMNPERPPKKTLIGAAAKNTFIKRLLFILGGAAIVMIALAIVVAVAFGNKTNLQDLVAITQAGQEIARLSDEGNKATDQQIKNAAINTRLSIRSQQQDWLSFLKRHGRDMTPEELSLKHNATIDKTLTTAKQTSTFDTTYSTTLRSQLESYSNSLKVAYNHATNKTERSLLDTHFKEVQLLLTQWPSDLSVVGD